MKRNVAFACMLLFVAWSLALVQAEHKVVAVVLKNPNFQGVPVLKLNAHKVLSAPYEQATIQQTTPLVANAVNQVATPNFVANDAAPVPVMNEKPKKVIRYKLLRVSDEDIKKEAEAKKLKQLKDAEDAKMKKVFYPCRDYSPICGRYKNLWNPGVAQCRDVWMQRNCRETCGLCKIPVGVYLACNDMWHCKKLATHSCVHEWVRKTCKSMCGSCDGSKGGGFARVGASSVFVGKKKSLVEAKNEKKEDGDKRVKTVHEAVKLQAKPIKVEGLISKDSKEETESDDDEKDDIENDESGDNTDDKENDDDKDDDDEMEKQPADVNMENESGDDEETKDDKSEPEPKAASKPAKHATVPKVIKKIEQKPVVQKTVAPKVQHHKQKKTAKKVVHDKKPKAKKVKVVKKVHDEKPKAKKVKVVKKVHDEKPKAKKVKVVKKVHDKKAKNPVKALVMKQKKTAHHKTPAKKVKTATIVAKKN